MFSRFTRSPVSTAAAITLRAAFLAPLTRTRPARGRPPLMRNSSLARGVGRYSQENGFTAVMGGFSPFAAEASNWGSLSWATRTGGATG